MIKKIAFLLMAMAFFTVIKAQSIDDETLSIQKDLKFFETPMALGLKKRFKKKDIEKIKNADIKNIAVALFNKQYQPQYKFAQYEAYLTPTTLGKQLMIGDGYSKFEGITGVYLPKGKHIVLVSNIPNDQKAALVVPNWLRMPPDAANPTKDPAGWGVKRKTFDLKNGINIIELTEFDGLAYIDYYSDEPEKLSNISVHFVSGKVNGYFDLAKNNNEDWNQLINNAVYPVIDAKGKHIQIAYPAEACKKYAYGKGVELIKNYDSLVALQHQLLGLEKYHRVPKNHILARVNYNYYMFRDGDGVAYMGGKSGYAMGMVVNPASVIKGDPCWGFSHEVGHVHQLRPYLNWGGLGEVSNNLFSLYGTRGFGNKTRTSEQKNYQKSKDSIIAKGISYLQDGDVFNRLIPFWQLQLYFETVGKNKDFYPDLFEHFRLQGEAERAASKENARGGGWGDRGKNPANYQLNFVEAACKVGKTDLTEFFEKYGFFYVGSFKMDDYGSYNYEMTQEMVNKTKAAIKAMNLPKPIIDLTTLQD